MTRIQFASGRHLSKGHIAKKKNSIYQNAFHDLPSETIYWDPMGKMAQMPIDMRKEMFEREQPLLRQFDELQANGFSVGDSINSIQKSIGTGSWNLPVHFIPEIAVTNPWRTPAADLIPRISISENSVNVTEQTAQPWDSVGWNIETALGTFDGTYTGATGTYTDHDYDIVGYGLMTANSDQLSLAERGLRSTARTSTNMLATAIRQAEERQILYGTGTLGDSSGFQGFTCLGDQHSTVATATGFDVEDLRSLVDSVEYAGAEMDNLVVMTDFGTHRALRQELIDYTWYKPTNQQLDFGFKFLEFDGIPILKSHAIPTGTDLSTTTPYVFCADFSTTYMGMLQDLTMQPLAKLGPQERIAMDAYGVLVAENPGHIRYVSTS